MHQQPFIRLLDVTRTYPLGRVNVRALTGVSLGVGRGDFLALAGPSGSGKTTLLNLIGCIDKPDSGRIVIDGVDVTPVPLHRLAATRRDTLGFIFQTFNVIPVLTAYENVEYPLLLQHVPAALRRKRVLEWLEQVGLSDQLRERNSARPALILTTFDHDAILFEAVRAERKGGCSRTCHSNASPARSARSLTEERASSRSSPNASCARWRRAIHRSNRPTFPSR
jgi:ABC-type glutathione transport system ATPase component